MQGKESHHDYDKLSKNALTNSKAQWLMRSAGVPEFFGNQETWYDAILVLLTQIADDNATDLSAFPRIPNQEKDCKWSEYWAKLSPTKLVDKTYSGSLRLSEAGVKFMDNPTKAALAIVLHSQVRAFGEMLSLFEEQPLSVAAANKAINALYPSLKWDSINSTRRRIDWFRALGLLAESGRIANNPSQGSLSTLYEIQPAGRSALANMDLVPPEALTISDAKNLPVLPPVPESIIRLERDFNHQTRVRRKPKFSVLPSPRGTNNRKIDTIREILVKLGDGMTKNQMDEYLFEKYNYRSGQSMRTGLRAARLIEETKGQVFRATQACKDWIDSGDDINLIRILHTTLGFVGPILEATQHSDGVRTTELYDLEDPYPADNATIRLLINLMEEIEAIEEVRYLFKYATSLGSALLETLPKHTTVLAHEAPDEKSVKQAPESTTPYYKDLINSLHASSKDPHYNGEPSGEGFERVITEAFQFLGADARHIGGSGNTDVLVSLIDNIDQKRFVVDAKSKSVSAVDSSDIRETNLEEHRNMHDATGIVIVGNEFSNGHIQSWASRKPAALISVEKLSGAISAHAEFGLENTDLELLLTGRFEDFDQNVERKRRSLELIAVVINTLVQAGNSDEDDEDDRSPRDIWLEEKQGETRPSQDELCEIVELLAAPEIGAIEVAHNNDDKSKTSYRLKRNPSTTARMLHATANSIESGAKQLR